MRYIVYMRYLWEKPFECDVCKRRFGQKRLLQVHERTHTGEKPYRCGTCNKCFAQSSTLATHKKTHTGGGNVSNVMYAIRNLQLKKV